MPETSKLSRPSVSWRRRKDASSAAMPWHGHQTKPRVLPLLLSIAHVEGFRVSLTAKSLPGTVAFRHHRRPRLVRLSRTARSNAVSCLLAKPQTCCVSLWDPNCIVVAMVHGRVSTQTLYLLLTVGCCYSYNYYCVIIVTANSFPN